MDVDISALRELIEAKPVASTVIAVALAAFVIKKIESLLYQSPLSKIPTPSGSWPVLGHMPLFLKKGRTIPEMVLEVTTDLARKYEKEGIFLLTMGPKTTVFLCAPETVEPLMISNANIWKGVEYSLLSQWLGDGLLVTNGDKWRHDRKLITPAFHFKILDDFVPLINKHALILCNVIEEEHGTIKDLSEEVSHLTLAVISETSFGVNLSMKDESCRKYEDAFRDYAGLYPARLINPFLYNDFIYGLTPNGRKATKAVETLHAFTWNVIKTRKAQLDNKSMEQDTKAKSLLEILLPMGMSEKQIREQLDTFSFAGHDTTATAITIAIDALGRYPRIQKKVHDELNEIYGDDAPEEVTLDHIKRMTYIEAVVKEALRLNGAVPIVARKLFQEMKIKDYVIPRGTEVWVLFRAMHTSPTLYEKPLEFMPERFLGSKNDIKPFSYLPFSAGPRNCIGQRLALNEIKIVLAHVLSRYELRTLTDEPVVTFEGTLRIKDLVQIEFKKLR